MPETKPRHPVLEDIAVGAVIGLIALIVWFVAVGPDGTAWQMAVAMAVLVVIARGASIAWMRWRTGRSIIRREARR